MTTENQDTILCEQETVIAEIFANMIADANKMIGEQSESMIRQLESTSKAINLLIKDALLNICASTGVAYETVLPMVNNKAMALDANGHTDDEKDGSEN